MGHALRLGLEAPGLRTIPPLLNLAKRPVQLDGIHQLGHQLHALLNPLLIHLSGGASVFGSEIGFDVGDQRLEFLIQFHNVVGKHE